MAGLDDTGLMLNFAGKNGIRTLAQKLGIVETISCDCSHSEVR